jgi:SAM-dependent methyltransferase
LELAFEFVERLAGRSPTADDRGMARDLHESFADPREAEAAELTRFLLEVDRLPGIRAIQRAIAAAIDPRPGQRLLDAGCGIGLEALRLAEAHPDVSVTGLDRNAELLAIAARSTAGVEWVHADLMAVDVPSESFDAVRTERVLMYLADEAVDEIVRLVRPGGRLALFELDYGATILAPGGGDACGAVVEREQAALRAAVPQPWSGRTLTRSTLGRPPAPSPDSTVRSGARTATSVRRSWANRSLRSSRSAPRNTWAISATAVASGEITGAITVPPQLGER